MQLILKDKQEIYVDVANIAIEAGEKTLSFGIDVPLHTAEEISKIVTDDNLSDVTIVSKMDTKHYTGLKFKRVIENFGDDFNSLYIVTVMPQ